MSNENMNQPVFRLPDLDINPKPSVKFPNLPRIEHFASDYVDRLVHYINQFDKDIGEEYETRLQLVSFGNSVTIQVSDIGCYNPFCITFYGYLENGAPAQLVQHVSQINFLLTAIKREDLTVPKRSIGFREPEQHDDHSE
jgi:hypothetical protein